MKMTAVLPAVAGAAGTLLSVTSAHAAGGITVRSGIAGLAVTMLVLGVARLVARGVRRRRRCGAAGLQYDDSASAAYDAEPDDVDAGLLGIGRTDPGFDEVRFCDGAREMFLRVQKARTERDPAPVAELLTDEMVRVLREEAARQRRNGQSDHRDAVVVRNVDIVEAWQESGKDHVTALIYATHLDYTIDDATGEVVGGNRTVPVKCEELWTFTRSSGDHPWRLADVDLR